jgi:hypothetical protein
LRGQAACNAYDATANLPKQMFENPLDLEKRIDAVLSPKQRAQPRRGAGNRQ